eukprot:gene9147-1644_t
MAWLGCLLSVAVKAPALARHRVATPPRRLARVTGPRGLLLAVAYAAHDAAWQRAHPPPAYTPCTPGLVAAVGWVCNMNIHKDCEKGASGRKCKSSDGTPVKENTSSGTVPATPPPGVLLHPNAACALCLPAAGLSCLGASPRFEKVATKRPRGSAGPTAGPP